MDPQLILLLTTVAGFIVQAWRENRNRKWATEDRQSSTAAIIATATAEAEATRIKTLAIAETLRVRAELAAMELKAELQQTAHAVQAESVAAATAIRNNSIREGREIRDEQRAQSESLAQKIDATTAAAHEAYKEANHVNLKIEDLNRRLMKEQEMSSASTDTARTTGEVTLRAVEDIAKRGTEVTRQVQTVTDEIKAAVIPDTREIKEAVTNGNGGKHEK